MRLLRTVLRTLIRDESGQSLVVVVSSMTVMMGVAAFGIDAASWMARHHQAQVVADSAALAAAQCLANPGAASSSMVLNGTPTTVPSCSSTTDTADADQVAIDYAKANGLTISNGNITIKNNSVQIKATANSGGAFSAVSGISSTSQTAGAVASWTSTSGACTNPGSQNCDFMFAHDSTCPQGSTSHGITITQSGNSTVNGNVQSNSDLTSTSAGVPQWGTAEYGPGTYCQPTVTASGHYPWSSPPTQETSIQPFPIDYTKDFPACGGTGELPCKTDGYPPFCTVDGANITLTGSTNGDSTITNEIYCASGTSTNLADPSTWNGSITITLSGNNVLFDTYVGGSVSFTGSGNDTLSSCGYTTSGYSATNCVSTVPSPVTTNYPTFYATGSSSNAINVTVSGGQTFNGDMFSPNGGTTLTMSGNKTLTTFIEANDITATISGTLQGDGPTANGTGAGSPGNISLTQ